METKMQMALRLLRTYDELSIKGKPHPNDNFYNVQIGSQYFLLSREQITYILVQWGKR